MSVNLPPGTPERITASALARIVGVTPTAILYAVRRGNITRGPDRLFDAKQAVHQWVHRRADLPRSGITGGSLHSVEQQTRRGVPGRQRGRPHEPYQAPDGEEADGNDDDGGDTAAPTNATLYNARVSTERLKAEKLELDLAERRGELIKRSVVERHVFAYARKMRDDLLQVPPRVAANVAAELGADVHKVEVILTRLVNEYLSTFARQLEGELDLEAD